MKKLLLILMPLVFCCTLKAQEGCLVTSPLSPTSFPAQTYVPTCTGHYETITSTAPSGSYSNVQLTAGNTYIFTSSMETDFVTIGNENGTEVLASGIEAVTYESATDQIIRFYTHLDAECNFDILETFRSRIVQCGDIQEPLENDECEGAIPLENGETATGNTTNATDSGGIFTTNDVFYSYTSSDQKELVTVSLCGSDFDTFISIHNDCNIYGIKAINDDYCDLQSEVSFISDGNNTYYILVEGYEGETGDFTITVNSVPYEDNYACDEHSVSLENAIDGYESIQRPVIDIPVGENGLALSGMQIRTIGESSFFEVIIYSNTSTGVPGEQVFTTNAQIISEEVYYETMGLNFMNYTIQFDDVLELDPNTVYWLEARNDALAWSSTAIQEEAIGRYGLVYRFDTWQAIFEDFSYQLHCEDILGTDDLEKFNFAYYPNPATDVLNFKSDKAIKSVSVYNLAGQKIISDSKISNNQLNLSSIPTGNYVFRVELENGQIETFKIVKK